MNALPAILVVEDDHLIQSVVEEPLTEGGSKSLSPRRPGKPSNCGTVPARNIVRW